MEGGSSVRVVSKTWMRDSHHLFDLEAPEEMLRTSEFVVHESMNCIRHDADVRMQRPHPGMARGRDRLISLERDDQGLFWVQGASSSRHLNRRPWLVVRDLVSWRPSSPGR